MKNKNYKLLSLIFFALGILFLLNYEINITGAVIGIFDFSPGFSFIFGIIFIVISFIIFVLGERLKRGELEKIVEASKNLKNVPVYESLSEGIANSSDAQIFRAKCYNEVNKSYEVSLFCYVTSKEEAARIASRFIPDAKPIYQFMNKDLKDSFGKKGKSLDREELKKIAFSYLREHPGEDVRFKRRGFGRGQYDTETGGRVWEAEAYYDPPHPRLGIPFKHYNIHSQYPNFNLHSLIIPKKELVDYKSRRKIA